MARRDDNPPPIFVNSNKEHVMSFTKRTLSTILIAGALMGAGVAMAQPAPASGAPGAPALQDGRGDHGERGGPGGWHRGHGGPERMLRGLNLSQEQKDQVFNLVHAQQPAMREKMKALHQARKEVRKITLSDNYDAARVRQIATAQSQTLIELGTMRADLEHKIYTLLTSEQKQQLAQRMARWEEREGKRESKMDK
jgi:Spy/CpxP family protein refolding chaperone